MIEVIYATVKHERGRAIALPWFLIRWLLIDRRDGTQDHLEYNLFRSVPENTTIIDAFAFWLAQMCLAGDFNWMLDRSKPFGPSRK